MQYSTSSLGLILGCQGYITLTGERIGFTPYSWQVVGEILSWYFICGREAHVQVIDFYVWNLPESPNGCLPGLATSDGIAQVVPPLEGDGIRFHTIDCSFHSCVDALAREPWKSSIIPLTYLFFLLVALLLCFFGFQKNAIVRRPSSNSHTTRIELIDRVTGMAVTPSIFVGGEDPPSRIMELVDCQTLSIVQGKG
ncbi:hypothetical protein K458DRAFT_401243 [Lentithecium fluviatile CBS 122367]|uniref:Uncharacterized protein n=1 Tax=Lentithecium fluviatile CBS 122367 TaxID=1168545 RepID=A0A6G1JB82_9PLEO|nr:hypothetical protein K458DRAFT_401243 [Lentithecium fluviatile CBS 122367]